MNNPNDMLKHFIQTRKIVFEKVGHVIAEALVRKLTEKTAAMTSRAAYLHQVTP